MRGFVRAFGVAFPLGVAAFGAAAQQDIRHGDR